MTATPKSSRTAEDGRRHPGAEARASSRRSGPSPIEDYALIGDLHTAALISRRARSTGCACRGSTPPTMFGALLDSPEAGQWSSRAHGRGPRASSARICRAPSCCARCGAPPRARRRCSSSCRCTTAGRTWCAACAGCAAACAFARGAAHPVRLRRRDAVGAAGAVRRRHSAAGDGGSGCRHPARTAAQGGRTCGTSPSSTSRRARRSTWR